MFASDFETNTNVTTNRYDEKDSLKYSVDVRYFGLFIALQLFIQKTKSSISIDTRDKVNWTHVRIKFVIIVDR